MTYSNIGTLSVSKGKQTSTSTTSSKLFAVAVTTLMSASCPIALFAHGSDCENSKESITNSYLLNIFKTDFTLVKNCEVTAKRLGIEPPNDLVIQKAQSFLTTLTRFGINSDFVNPSYDGGIIIEFHKKNEYCLVEIYNDLDVVFLVGNQDTRRAWDYTHENFENEVNNYLLS